MMVEVASAALEAVRTVQVAGMVVVAAVPIADSMIDLVAVPTEDTTVAQAVVDIAAIVLVAVPIVDTAQPLLAVNADHEDH